MKIKKINLLSALIFTLSLLGCGKENDEAPNDFIDKQAGSYEVENWEKVTYQNNEPSGTESVDNVGIIVLDVVNFGFVSEGHFERNTEVNSLLLSYMDPNNPCFETFKWTGDDTRLTLSLGWCTQKFIYSLTLDGFKKKKQTWTLVVTDASSAITSKEVFTVRKK